MNVNEPTVFLDMDGVLVDFFGAFAKLANVEHWKQMDSQRLQGVLDKIVGSDYFAKLPKTNVCDSIVEMVSRLCRILFHFIFTLEWRYCQQY